LPLGREHKNLPLVVIPHKYFQSGADRIGFIGSRRQLPHADMLFSNQISGVAKVMAQHSAMLQREKWPERSKLTSGMA
jgi:hypothetical protein